MSQNITFGRSAYVPGTPDAILDKMEENLSITASVEGIVIITRESVEKFLKEDYPEMVEVVRARLRPLKEHLELSLQNIDQANDGTPIGEIFFVS